MKVLRLWKDLGTEKPSRAANSSSVAGRTAPSRWTWSSAFGRRSRSVGGVALWVMRKRVRAGWVVMAKEEAPGWGLSSYVRWREAGAVLCADRGGDVAEAEGLQLLLAGGGRLGVPIAGGEEVLLECLHVELDVLVRAGLQGFGAPEAGGDAAPGGDVALADAEGHAEVGDALADLLHLVVGGVPAGLGVDPLGDTVVGRADHDELAYAGSVDDVLVFGRALVV